MKILVTGGCGFMGSNFIRHLLTNHNDLYIINLDKLTYAGNPKNLEDVEREFGERYTFVKGDIAKKEDVEVADGADAIVNFAAETHVDRSIMDPDAFLKTDIIGTYNLLEAAKRHKVRWFLQVSTDEVYGSIDEGEFTERSPFKPNSPYSASKASADLLCRAYYKTYNLPVAVTHSCNVYGPYQYPEKLIPLFITNLLEGKKVPVYGKGNQVREWIYIEDYCRALDKIMYAGTPGDVYNIGSGDRLKNIDVTKKILELFGKDEKWIEQVDDRAGHDMRYAVNCDILRDTGWEPYIPFDVGIVETVKWYRKNKKWWKPIKTGEYLEYYKKQYEGNSISRWSGN